LRCWRAGGSGVGAEGNLTASVVANPSKGSPRRSFPTGRSSCRPNASFSGLDRFTNQANDGSLDSNVVTAASIAVGGNLAARTNQDVPDVQPLTR